MKIEPVSWGLMCLFNLLAIGGFSPEVLARPLDEPQCKGIKIWYDGKCLYPEEVARLKKDRKSGGKDKSVPVAVDKPQQPSPEMMKIPGGQFTMGCNLADDEECQFDERPEHEVLLDEFLMDEHEVTVAEYRQCVDAAACTPPVVEAIVGDCNWKRRQRDSHPVNCVDWFQARTYCEWAGKRLPTEAEWERAARGTEHRLYPWIGTAAHCFFAVMNHSGVGCGKGRTWPVCSKAEGKSTEGLCDMAGNVSEWVADWYDANFYSNSSPANPWNSLPSAYKLRRGGSWYDGAEVLRCAHRGRSEPSVRLVFVGFRCAKSVSK